MNALSRRLTSLAIAISVIALAALTGCKKSSSSEITEVRLGYFPNVTHAQAVLGVSSGDFQTALGPIKLVPKTFNAGPQLIEALNNGAIDVGYVGPGPALSDCVASHGQGIRVIAGAAANGVVIVARAGSGIESLKDLVGKKIATPQSLNTQDISARHYLTAVLGQPNADNVVPIPNSQQAGMMSRGHIDAAWVPEPWGARLISETGAKLIAEEKDTWPDHQFALTVIVTTPQFLANHPDIIRKLLAVHNQWTQRLQRDPKSCADQLNTALAALTGAKLPPDVLAGALQRTPFTDDPIRQTFQTMGQWENQLHIADQTPDLSGLFDTSIMESLASLSPTTKP